LEGRVLVDKGGAEGQDAVLGDQLADLLIIERAARKADIVFFKKCKKGLEKREKER
jgi:hypothetical protein